MKWRHNISLRTETSLTIKSFHIDHVPVSSDVECSIHNADPSHTNLALPKNTGTGGCMRSTSRMKLFRSGISLKASSDNSLFDSTVLISFFILCL